MFDTSTASAQGVDRIRRRSGTLSGEITNISTLAVTISKGGVEQKVPVEDIRTIDFAGEPEDLRPARLAANAGRYQDALDRLGAISLSDVEREAIRQDIDYLRMACQVQLALAGQGNLDQAAQEASAFLKKNRNSYRVSAALELLGNAQMARGEYDTARQEYEKLARAPSPYFQARSAILKGRLFQAQDNHAEALIEFEKALAAAQKSAAAQPEELEATLHRAVSQSATGKVEEATSTLKEIIAQAEPKETKLLARAYNALGDCYLQSGNDKAARDAFLHVDVLFSAAKTEHAKALFELSRLWRSQGQETRANDARQRLEKEYPASRWGKQ
ncbi:MAG: tetratricopeptide repeat protein [Pirellulales bacterium]|nr:tetratricopeptide repeat protein [Pirellulales bacterium]